MPHQHAVRVYYEDTDLAGIVYYANYLKYIERARTEWVRDCGVDQTRLRAEAGMVFAVRRVVADYLAPARFDDVLSVTTELRSAAGVRCVLEQAVLRDGRTLFTAEVTLVCLNATGQPTRLPAVLRTAITRQTAG